MGPNTSKAGRSSRSGASAASPASAVPHQHPARPTTFCPTSSDGTNGAGDAVITAASVVDSSLTSAAHARYRWSTSRPRSSGNPISPPTTGPNGCKRNSKLVTTPKFPPPPRKPQMSSGSSVLLARRMSPDAVTTSAAVRLSAARPYLRINHPIPPPSVSPATPVCEIKPPGLANPCACVAASKSAHVAPGCTRAVRPGASTTTSRIGERSSMIPSSHELRPARL